jgi:hypothetical protein
MEGQAEGQMEGQAEAEGQAVGLKGEVAPVPRQAENGDYLLACDVYVRHLM